MDQDKAFEGYWEANRERLLWIAPGLSGQVKDFAREVWYGSANANATNNKFDGVLTPLELLEALSKMGGAAGALGEAGLIFEKKGKDYNTGFGRDDYFPLGLASYAQMLWVKALRLLSFAKQPRLANFEGPRDTALDLINYAAFLADWLERRKGE